MINIELKEVFKKWDIILSENAISFTGHKDHPNASLCYMLYCLTIGKPFNLAYYIAYRMVSVTQSSDMTILYAMLLTRLYKHVWANHPYALSNDFQLVDHVMIPLSNKRVFRLKTNGKRPRLPTPSDFGSSESPPTSVNQGTSANQEVPNDPVDNYTLDPIPYLNQLPPIKGGEYPEFKQTKDTTLALSIPPQSIIQTTLNLEPFTTPLAPRALTFSNQPRTPLESYPYLSSTNEIPPRPINPLPQLILPQTLPQTTPLTERERIQQEINNLQTFHHNVQEAIQNAQHVQDSLIPPTSITHI
ncbi:hypothetical protein Tco_1210891 [Tanacetum coccineum]